MNKSMIINLFLVCIVIIAGITISIHGISLENQKFLRSFNSITGSLVGYDLPQNQELYKDPANESLKDVSN